MSVIGINQTGQWMLCWIVNQSAPPILQNVDNYVYSACFMWHPPHINACMAEKIHFKHQKNKLRCMCMYIAGVLELFLSRYMTDGDLH